MSLNYKSMHEVRQKDIIENQRSKSA